MTRRNPSWQWRAGYKAGYALGKLSVLLSRWQRRRETRRPYVTPGHPTRQTHGYDCHCPDCIAGRAMRGESS